MKSIAAVPVQLDAILNGYQSLRDLWNAYHELADCLADRPWMQPDAASVLLHAVNAQFEERLNELETFARTHTPQPSDTAPRTAA